MHEIGSFFQFAEASDDLNVFEGIFATAYKITANANTKLLFNLQSLFKYNSTENLFRAITLPFRNFLNQTGGTRQDIKAISETCIDLVHNYFAFYQKEDSVRRYGGWILSENLGGISNEHREWLAMKLDREACKERGYGVNVFLSRPIGEQEVLFARLYLSKGSTSKSEEETIVEIRGRGKEVWMCGGSCAGCPRTAIKTDNFMLSLYLLNQSQLVFYLNGQALYQHKINANLIQDSSSLGLSLGLLSQYQGVLHGLLAVHDGDLELPQVLWQLFPEGLQQFDQLDQFKSLLGNKEVANFLSPVECCTTWLTRRRGHQI